MMTSPQAKRPTAKLLMQMVIGAVCGAAATSLFLVTFGDAVLERADPGTAIAVLTGIVYALLGLFVGFGALSPRLGARLLNVEDEEEIREERGKLAPSALACILIGLFLMILAVGQGVEEAATRRLLAAAALACLLGCALLTVRMRRRTDEMLRLISLEASALTLHLTILLLGLWATLGLLGYRIAVDPLSCIAGLAALQLAAIFWLIGRKGLLKPR